LIDRACISLNNRCDLHCRYCHFSGKTESGSKRGADFSSAEVEGIVDNIAEYCKAKNVPTFKLGIVGAGEPLLSFSALAALGV
jgi:uncharacterized protein